jgi:hypothetical protein
MEFNFLAVLVLIKHQTRNVTVKSFLDLSTFYFYLCGTLKCMFQSGGFDGVSDDEGKLARALLTRARAGG